MEPISLRPSGPLADDRLRNKDMPEGYFQFPRLTVHPSTQPHRQERYGLVLLGGTLFLTPSKAHPHFIDVDIEAQLGENDFKG